MCIHARRHSSRQVFGLAGFLLTPASQFVAEPVLNEERSFLLTAAGQFRIHTGFPFQLIENDQPPSSKTTISRIDAAVNHNSLWCLCKTDC